MPESRYDVIANWYDEMTRTNTTSQDMILSSLFELLGDIQGQHICDLACGQGHISRLMAQKGANVTGIDLSEKLVEIAKRDEATEPLGIVYHVDDAESLVRLNNAYFDAIVCNLALMDIEHLSATLQSVWRVLKLGGRFFFTLTHPCFQSPHASWIDGPHGQASREIKSYFVEGFWQSTYPHGVRGQVGAYHRKLSTYIQGVIDAGFQISAVKEPQTIRQTTDHKPDYAVVPTFLIMRCDKPDLGDDAKI